MVAFNIPDWEPDEYAIEWTHQLIRATKEGAVWGHPATGNVYKFLKSKKELHLVSGDASLELHINTVKVFEHIGWKVIDDRKSNS